METFINSIIDLIMMLGFVSIFITPILVCGFIFEKFLDKNHKIREKINNFFSE